MFPFFLSKIGLIQIDCVNFSTKSLTLFVITQYMQVDLCRSWRLNILDNSGTTTTGFSWITTISHVAFKSTTIATVSSISVPYFTFPAEKKWKKKQRRDKIGSTPKFEQSRGKNYRKSLVVFRIFYPAPSDPPAALLIPSYPFPPPTRETNWVPA